MNLNATSWLESLFNRLLADDQEHKKSLLKYRGRVLVVEFINTRASYAMNITDYGISLTTEIPVSADVTIKTTPLGLVNYLGAVKRSEPLVSGVMEITGDIALAQGILSVIRDLKVDWEEYLSEWTGDILAHKAGSLMKNSKEVFQYARRSLQNDLVEYLQYESSHLISGSDMQEFNGQIEKLRDDAERLKARIEAIRKTGEEKG